LVTLNPRRKEAETIVVSEKPDRQRVSLFIRTDTPSRFGESEHDLLSPTRRFSVDTIDGMAFAAPDSSGLFDESFAFSGNALESVLCLA
jgi:hypothetical protein